MPTKTREDRFIGLFTSVLEKGLGSDLPTITSYQGDEIMDGQRQRLVDAYAEVFSPWNDPSYQEKSDPTQKKLRHLTEQGTFTDGSLVTLSEGSDGMVYAFTITKTRPMARTIAIPSLQENILSIYPHINLPADIPFNLMPTVDSPSEVLLYNDLGVRKNELKAHIGTGPLAKVLYVSYMLNFMDHHLKSLSETGTKQATPLVFWTIKKSRMYTIAAKRPEHFAPLASIEASTGVVSDVAPQIFIFETTLGDLQKVTAGPVEYLRTSRHTPVQPQPIQNLYYELK